MAAWAELLIAPAMLVLYGLARGLPRRVAARPRVPLPLACLLVLLLFIAAAMQWHRPAQQTASGPAAAMKPKQPRGRIVLDSLFCLH
ncbi:hypothetical protein WI697_26470 [Tistrella mobilis]|uniref:hypothetical protein n=1 Tax=Tistrella mobilis TaxID=171437 RepID=UPI0031F62FD6